MYPSDSIISPQILLPSTPDPQEKEPNLNRVEGVQVLDPPVEVKAREVKRDLDPCQIIHQALQVMNSLST